MCPSVESIKYIRNLFSKWSHILVLGRNILNREGKSYDDIIHLEHTIKWLVQAQEVLNSGGVSAAYSLIHGWLPEYPETTGYIIQTLLNYVKFSNDTRYIEKAISMGDWEIKVQLPNGGVRALFGLNDYPDVFNTGQVIIGWVDLYKYMKDIKYLEAAKKAGDFLVENQDSNGAWSKHSLNQIPHSYHSRVSYSLLMLFGVTDEPKYRIAAEKNIKWVLSNITSNDWIEFMGFFKEIPPFTHTISYTLEGLLESKEFMDKDTQIQIEKITYAIGNKICKIYQEKSQQKGIFFGKKLLSATYDKNWESKDKYSCITGNAQLAWVWMKLFEKTKESTFLAASVKIIDQIKRIQMIKIKDQNVKGAIPGSYPIWGAYSPYSYPNWAAKFFADALMLKINNKY